MPDLRSINGNPNAGRFPCLWCGAKFTTRAWLEAHWQESPGCFANRTVSNQTQSKMHTQLGEDGNPMLTMRQPGSETLRKVRENEEP